MPCRLVLEPIDDEHGNADDPKERARGSRDVPRESLEGSQAIRLAGEDLR